MTEEIRRTPIDGKSITDRLASVTLARGAWGDNGSACLLATIHPPCGDAQSWEECPESLMPMWMAAVTIEINDSVSDHLWESTVERYAKEASSWHVLDDAQWRNILMNSLETLLGNVVLGEAGRGGSMYSQTRSMLERRSPPGDPGWNLATDESSFIQYNEPIHEDARRCAWYAILSSVTEDPGVAAIHALQAFEGGARSLGCSYDRAWDNISMIILDAIRREIDASGKGHG